MGKQGLPLCLTPPPSLKLPFLKIRPIYFKNVKVVLSKPTLQQATRHQLFHNHDKSYEESYLADDPETTGERIARHVYSWIIRFRSRDNVLRVVTYPADLCGRRLQNSTSSTVHTAPLTFSTRVKHLCSDKL